MGAWTDGRGFLGSDGLQSGTMLAMVEPNRAHGDQGSVWVGSRWHPGAQPSLQHQPVGLLLIEMQQCGADQLFEGRQTTVFDHRLQDSRMPRSVSILIKALSIRMRSHQLTRWGEVVSPERRPRHQTVMDQTGNRAFSIGAHHLNGGWACGVLKMLQR